MNAHNGWITLDDEPTRSGRDCYLQSRHIKDQQVTTRGLQLKAEIEKFYMNPASVIQSTTAMASQRLNELEEARNMEEMWILIDMDMFYAQVELRDQPELKMKPLAVVHQNMITSANYVARGFGVKSGIPVYQGKLKCKDLICLPSNMDKYKEVATEVRNVFYEYDDKFETKGLDEAYLLVTSILNKRRMNHDEGREALAKEIRERVFAKTGLTSSAGIACNKLLAKICSQVNKPNGQYYLPPNAAEIRRFMLGRKVTDIPGVGKVLDDICKVYICFPTATCTMLYNAALGIGTNDHSERLEDQRSFSACKTIPPTNEISVLESLIRGFSDQVALEMRRKSAQCRTVGVFLKSQFFEDTSRCETLQQFVTSAEDVYRVALKVLRQLYPLQPVRTIGVRVSHLCYLEAKALPGQLKQTQLVPTQPQAAPIRIKRRKQPSGEEDYFWSLMSHSILPNRKLAPGALLAKHTCPICGQE